MLARQALFPLLVLPFVAGPSPCGGGTTTANKDLSAVGICYFISPSGSQLKIHGIIQNSGTQVVDFSASSTTKGTYTIAGNIEGVPRAELPPATLTKGGLKLQPGEKSVTSQGLDLPFSPTNKYSNFELYVTLEGDQKPDNNRYIENIKPSMTGAALQNMQAQYTCPW